VSVGHNAKPQTMMYIYMQLCRFCETAMYAPLPIGIPRFSISIPRSVRQTVYARKTDRQVRNTYYLGQPRS